MKLSQPAIKFRTRLSPVGPQYARYQEFAWRGVVGIDESYEPDKEEIVPRQRGADRLPRSKSHSIREQLVSETYLNRPMGLSPIPP